MKDWNHQIIKSILEKTIKDDFIKMSSHGFDIGTVPVYVAIYGREIMDHLFKINFDRSKTVKITTLTGISLIDKYKNCPNIVTSYLLEGYSDPLVGICNYQEYIQQLRNLNINEILK